MMHKIRFMHIAAAAALLLIATPALACEGNTDCSLHAAKSSSYSAHGKGKGHHNIPGSSLDYVRKIMKMADPLSLSAKQRDEVATLLVEAEADSAEAHAKAEVAVATFRSKLHSGKVSDAEVQAYTRQMGALRAERLQARLAASVQASRMLSEEQRAALYAGHKGWKK